MDDKMFRNVDTTYLSERLPLDLFAFPQSFTFEYKNLLFSFMIFNLSLV